MAQVEQQQNITWPACKLSAAPDMPWHDVLLTKSPVAVRASITAVVRDEWIADETATHLGESAVGIEDLLLLLIGLVGEGVLEGNKLDGVFDDCRALEFHQVLDAEACLHSVPSLHPQKDGVFLEPKLV